MKRSDPAKAELSAPKQHQFAGTDNPRHLRALHFLLGGPIPREAPDDIAGPSNSPELVTELRRRGLQLPCESIESTDRDGCPCLVGVYSLTTADRRKIYARLARRESSANA
jgi:hypothetical protein